MHAFLPLLQPEIVTQSPPIYPLFAMIILQRSYIFADGLTQSVIDPPMPIHTFNDYDTRLCFLTTKLGLGCNMGSGLV
jgi:hypothetical protein